MPGDNFFDFDTIGQDDFVATEALFGEGFEKKEEEEVDPVKKQVPKKEDKKEDKKQQVQKQQVKKEKTDEEEEEEIADPTEALFGKGEEGDGKEKEEDEEEGEEKEEDKSKEDEEEDLNQFESLSKELYRAGVFVPDIDENGEEIEHVADNPEAFKKLFDYQKRAGMMAMLENHLSRFGQDRLELFEAIFNKGVDPKQYIPVYNNIADFENLSLETEAAQEMVVREAYKRNGLPEDRISSKIQRLKDISELQSEAEDMKTLIVEQDKRNLKKQEDDKQAQLENEKRIDQEYKSSLVKILTEKIKQKDFDGIPVNERTAQKAFEYLYSKKWKSQDGKKLTDFEKLISDLDRPENYNLKVKIGLLALQNFDLSSVQKKAVSKESSELFQTLTKHKTKQGVKKQEKATPWDI